MKFYKILSTALLFPALMAISSCEEEMSDYTPAEPVTGTQVYFEGAVNTDFTVNAVDTVFTVKLTRVQKDSAATVALRAEAVVTEADSVNTDSVKSAILNKFVFPSVATFAAGEATTTITCIAKVDSMEFDTPYTVKLCIANEEDATLYGQSFVTLKVTCPAPWKSMGMATVVDDIMTSGWNVPYTPFKVEIQENELVPGLYRLVNPYTSSYPFNEPGDYDDSKDYYLEIHAEDPNAVWFARTELGLDWGYGMISAWSIADYYITNGKDQEFVKQNGYYGTLKDGEITFPEKTILFNMPQHPSGDNWYYSNSKGMFSILLPGYVKADYSLALEFAGLFTKPDGSMFAVGNLTLGADASEVKAIVMPADADAAAVADAIAAGELEATDVEAGRIEVPFNAEELGGNNFQIVVVVLAEGAVKSVAAASFEYYGAGNNNPWQSLGTGLYTDDVLLPLFYENGTPATYEVEILEHSENPGLYRIMNPYAESVHPAGDDTYAPEGMYIEVNATDAEGVYIQLQSLGMDWGYGEMQLVTNGYRFIEANGFDVVKSAGFLGKVVEGVVTFPNFNKEAPNELSETPGFQALLYMGDSGYYAGMNGKMEIVLPGANTFARNMAIAKANTTKREFAKKSFSGAKATKKMYKLRNLTAEIF